MRGRTGVAKDAVGAFLSRWHLSFPAQCASLPSNPCVWLFEYCQILNSFFQTASSSEMYRPCMTWPPAPSPVSFLTMPPTGLLEFLKTVKCLPTSRPLLLSFCYFVFCLAVNTTDLNSSFRFPPSGLIPRQLQFVTEFGIIWSLSIFSTRLTVPCWCLFWITIIYPETMWVFK